MKLQELDRIGCLTARACPWVLSILALNVALGCDKKSENSEPSDTKAAASAAEPQKGALEPELARAMQSVTQAPKPGGAANQEGPPPNGVFEPGRADAQIRLGEPAKLVLGSAGGVPKVKLGGEVKAGLKRQLKLSTTLDIANSQLPVDLTLALETKAEGAAFRVLAKVTAVALAASAGAPGDAKGALDALKGSEISYLLSPTGVPSGFAYKAASAKSGGLIQILITAKDVLATVVQPFPEQAIGPEAFWMTTTREGVWDLDMVTYRMVKVTRIEGDSVTLSLDTKRYAASSSFETPFVSADAPLMLLQLEAVGQAQITLTAGDVLPAVASVNGKVAAAVAARGEPNAAQGAQVVQASWVSDLTVVKKP